MKKLLVVALVVTLGFSEIYAQDEPATEPYKPSSTQFMIRGYAHAGLEYKKVGDEVQSTFLGSSFVPIFIFKPSDKLLFETELEFAYNGNEVEVGFEYANASYVLSDYLILRMGKFMLPFGTFTERLHPAWINKLSNAPLGFGHGGIAPAAGVGVELRGAAQLGSAKILYYAYATNGPRLNTGLDGEPDEAGQLMFDNLVDNNNKKAYGGRLGLLPLSNSSLELGASIYGGAVGDKNDSLYSAVGSMLYAFDFSYVRQVSAIGGILDIKAQYNLANVDKATYFEPVDDGSGNITLDPYTFENSSNAYFTQVAYRPSMAGNELVKNFEILGRYSVFNAPEGAEWEQQSTQWSVGLNYWLSWRTVFKLNYQNTVQVGGHGVPDGETLTTDGIFFHWAMGF